MLSCLVTLFIKDTTQFQKIYLSVWGVLCLVSGTLNARDWTVYLYLEAHNASSESLKQIEELLKDEAGHVKLCIDMHDGSTVYRTLVGEGGTTSRSRCTEIDPCKVVMSGCYELFHERPQGNSMVILSAHGTGILRPTFNSVNRSWHFEPDQGDSPCTRYAYERYAALQHQIAQAIQSTPLDRKKSGYSWLTADNLYRCMSYASELLGKRIDIIGLDSCNMAMIEIAYEIRNCGHYLVASQEYEEIDGWDYVDMMQALRDYSPASVARYLVYNYERLQRTKNRERYSLSAIDLMALPDLIASLDSLCWQVTTRGLRRTELLPLLCRVRTELYALSGPPGYVDLKEFLERLYTEIGMLHRNEEIEKIMDTLLKSIELLNRAIIGTAAHTILGGCSVYFPCSHIDSSYRCLFTSDSRWISLLRFFTGTSIETT